MDELDQSLLTPSPDASIPRIRLGEIGYTGLQASRNVVLEESNRKFRFPQLIKTVDEMKVNPTIAAALYVYKMALGRVKWEVEAPVGASTEQKEKAKFIETCMHDMETPWHSFIDELSNYVVYGYQIHEKVYRRSLKTTGSKYNDGLIRWRALPVRGQNTISKWDFTEDGRDVKGVYQQIAAIAGGERLYNLASSNGEIYIPKQKYLHFVSGGAKGNPEGESILKPCYTPYKQLQAVQDQELIGMARDLGGLPVLSIPPRYMSPDASEEDKAVFNSFKRVAANITSGEQSSVVLPLAYDPETKMPLFKFELLESKGGKNYDTDVTIRRLQNDILTVLGCDIIKLGSDTNGSFSLADSKTNLLAMRLEYILQGMASVINHDLIPQTFALNGWTDTEFPRIVYKDIEQVDMEVFSKYIQRIKAVGLLEVTRPVLNKILETMGLPPEPADMPVPPEMLTQDNVTSRSGDSFNTASGGIYGTSDQVPTNNTSDLNTENTA